MGTRPTGQPQAVHRIAIAIARRFTYLWAPTSSCLPSGDHILVADGSSMAGRDAQKLLEACGSPWPGRAKAERELAAVNQSSMAGQRGRF